MTLAYVTFIILCSISKVEHSHIHLIFHCGCMFSVFGSFCIKSNCVIEFNVGNTPVVVYL